MFLQHLVYTRLRTHNKFAFYKLKEETTQKLKKKNHLKLSEPWKLRQRESASPRLNQKVHFARPAIELLTLCVKIVHKL